MKALTKEHVSSAKLLSFGVHCDTKLCRLFYKFNPHGVYLLCSQKNIKFNYNKAHVLFIDARVISIVQWKSPNVLQKGLNWL